MSSNMAQLYAVRGGQRHEQQKHSSFTCGVSRHTEQHNHVLSSSSTSIKLSYNLLKHQVHASDHRRQVHHGHATGSCVLQDSLFSRKPVHPSKPLKHAFHCSKGTPSYQQRSGSTGHGGHQTRAFHLTLHALRIVTCRRHAMCSTAVVGSVRTKAFCASGEPSAAPSYEVALCYDSTIRCSKRRRALLRSTLRHKPYALNIVSQTGWTAELLSFIYGPWVAASTASIIIV